jgi:iron complex transport system substrate-binding protein
MRALRLSILAFCLAASAAIYADTGDASADKNARSPFSPSYSKGFSIEYHRGYKLLEVKSPWPGASKGFSYVLYPRGSPRPAGVAADGFFETPLRRVVTFSTTYIPQIVVLGEADSIVGVDSAKAVSSPEIRSRIEAGKTLETSRSWAPDIERLISLAPDAIFTYGMGNEWDQHPKLAEAGLPTVISGEWNETDPLARAEWIGFIAAFYDKEALAAAYFGKVAAEYERIRALAAKTKERPTVLVNGPFQGSWTVAGGGSYMARFLSDAGASYLWADDRSSGGITLSIEAVYARALEADFWLNPALSVNSKRDIVALDRRFASLPCLAAGRVWNNNLRIGREGGNDYFESAILHPDTVLADLVKIFHPGLFAETPFSYYKNVAK